MNYSKHLNSPHGFTGENLNIHNNEFTFLPARSLVQQPNLSPHTSSNVSKYIQNLAVPRLLHSATTTSTPSLVLLLPLNAPWPAPLLPWSTILQTKFLLLNIRQTNQGLVLTLQLRTKLLYSDSWLWSCLLSSVISMHAITYQPYPMPPCFLFSATQRHSEDQGYHLMRCTIIVPEQLAETEKNTWFS
jgi:hypothetical protein